MGLHRMGLHMINTVFYWINILYMEFIFHLYFWRNVQVSLIPMVLLALCIALVQSFVQGFLKGKKNSVFFWICMGADYLLFASQLVYRSIFKQPLLLDAIIYGASDALTDYWREALVGILQAGTGLLALFLCIVWTIVTKRLYRQEIKAPSRKSIAVYTGCIAGTLLLQAGTFWEMYHVAPERYTDYQEFFYPDDILADFGVTAFWCRDLGILPLPELEEDIIQAVQGTVSTDISNETDAKADTDTTEGTEQEPDTVPEREEETPDILEKVYRQHVLDVDVEALREAGSDDVDKVLDYVLSIEPTMENDYTGMFEGYNFIYITAEGFSTAAIDEELTPTLYQLTHSGVVAEEYYVPLWQTSTSDGEYVNLTGLIPDQQFSMKRSADNSQPFSLANYFAKEGAVCYAYHNNSLSYYDRHLSHNNLGYFFKAAKLGELSEEEWGDHIFQMEHANYWPQSDLEMMQATIPEYINEERFHVYYMTVSGHMNYDFTGNRMSSLHKDEVSELPYSEEGKAYIACNIELDRALAYLIQELSAAGRLDDTVICLSADHYPYAMNVEHYEELMGMELENSLDLYRNSLILWNSQMETVEVTKPCSSLDLMPTILNLFGFEFDSRLYSGRDIFSDSEPLVVFSNRSFITDKVSYNKKTGEVLSRNGEPVDETYIEDLKSYVRLLHKHSAGILNYDFYKYFYEALRVTD